MYDPMKQSWGHKIIAPKDPREACCPIIDKVKTQDYIRLKVLGTVFFVSPAGLFLTAKHVIDEYENIKDNPLYLILLREPDFKLGKVIVFHIYPNTDLAIGLVDLRNEGWKPKIFRLSKKILSVGTKIATFGYAKTEQKIENNRFQICLNPYFYEGEVSGYYEAGISISRWPVYSHTFESSPGISGGPVFTQQSTVVYGACCTGFDPPPGGTFSDISKILDMPIPFVQDEWSTLNGIAEHRPDMVHTIES